MARVAGDPWGWRSLVACPSATWIDEGEGPAGVIGRALTASRLPPIRAVDPDDLPFHPRQVAVADVAALHPPSGRAALLRHLALHGVPLVTDELTVEVTDVLGPSLASAVQRLRLPDLSDEEVVGLAVSAARRAALRAEVTAGRLTPPGTTILLATRRPGRLEVVARLLAAQVGAAVGPVQVVVALHGPDFGGDAARIIRQAVPDALVVACDARQPFGSVLQAAVERADGLLLAKLDDDDHYAPWHVDDLALTAAAEGAAVIGRAAEFVHLAGPDVTVRRRFGITAGWADQVAGGALAVTREALEGVGGWAPLARGVDADLLSRVRRVGGRVFRAPPQGYLLVRHGDGHTWAQADEVFLDQAERHWRGRALDVAGVTG